MLGQVDVSSGFAVTRPRGIISTSKLAARSFESKSGLPTARPVASKRFNGQVDLAIVIGSGFQDGIIETDPAED